MSDACLERPRRWERWPSTNGRLQVDEKSAACSASPSANGVERSSAATSSPSSRRAGAKARVFCPPSMPQAYSRPVLSGNHSN